MNCKSFFSALFILFASTALTSCNSSEDPLSLQANKTHYQGEYIYRRQGEYRFMSSPPQFIAVEPYSWEQGTVGSLPRITKEFFRCKGSNLNPARNEIEKEQTVRYADCGGVEKHSLPLRNQKEFIYPILIDILNYIQEKTKKRVVVTSGHRCPEHNSYVDPSPKNSGSKHMIGAEVSFYVQGSEEKPEAIVNLIKDYYKSKTKYQAKKDYLDFQRYEKEDVDVTTKPWYNKEIFIKIFTRKEGRNFDNRHPYPYISIQVRFDEETQQKVIYTWPQANQNYLRH